MTLVPLQSYIEDFVRDFLASPAHNNLGPGTEEKAWQDHVLAYASADDDLWDFWKEHIGAFHWTPSEAFVAGMVPEALDRAAAAVPEDRQPADPSTPAPRADELTVVSWALSHTDVTKKDNRREDRLPSERWARTRFFGQKHNRALHRALVSGLAQQGYEAVAPALLPAHCEKPSPDLGDASNWSERHVAYTAGLGTFSLCGGLITTLGQAVRLGSVVVRAVIPATPRPYEDPYEYCLHFNGGNCTACARRCPVGSMDGENRDKQVCADYLEVTTKTFVQNQYGFDGYGCGLCQTGVPCESRIPPR